MSRRPAPSRRTAEKAREILSVLEGRVRREHPDWAARPEDPAMTLLELWAELAAELEERIEGSDDRVLTSVLTALGLEPSGPRAATGVVRVLAEDRGPVCLPAGSHVHPERGEGDTWISFETRDDCWVGGSVLRRAFTLDRETVRLLPVAAGPGAVAAEPAFGSRDHAGRVMLLGDRLLETLRASESAVTLEWSAALTDLAQASWEYSVEGGWSALEASFRLDEEGREPPVLRMEIHGPLVDLARRSIEESRLAWLRCRLPDDPVPALSVPTLRGKGATGVAPRPVERLFAESGGLLEDLSFSRDTASLGRRPADLDPAIVFGLEGDGPLTVLVRAGPASAGERPASRASGALPALWNWNPVPPQLVWERRSERGWVALRGGEIEDGSGGFQRQGCIHLLPGRDWEPVELYGECLHWVRARFVAGAYVDPVPLASLDPGTVEVEQGRTLSDQPLVAPGGGWNGWFPVPELPEGAPASFDRLAVECRGERESWSRVDSFAVCDPSEPCFVLRRAPDGSLHVGLGAEAGGGRSPSPGARVIIPVLRAGLGARGNLPAGSLLHVESAPAGILGVDQFLPTFGGQDVEDPEVFRRRITTSGERTGRLVTAADYRGLVEALRADILLVDVLEDPDPNGDVLVVLLPRETNPASVWSPEWLEALGRCLEDHSPPGTAVRVVSGSLHPAALEVEIRGEPEQPSEILSGVRTRLAEIVPGTMVSRTGTGQRAQDAPPVVVIAARDLDEADLRRRLGPEIRRRGGPGLRVERVRLRLLDTGEQAGSGLEACRRSFRAYLELREVNARFDKAARGPRRGGRGARSRSRKSRR